MVYRIEIRGWTISTHSLTKRLTYINAGTLIVRDISTHSLTKRLTIASRTLPGGLEYFNSQPHEEADAVLLLLFALLTYFNSQPHEEADGVLIVSTSPSAYFNSQPHEEADEIRIYWICRA